MLYNSITYMKSILQPYSLHTVMCFSCLLIHETNADIQKKKKTVLLPEVLSDSVDKNNTCNRTANPLDEINVKEKTGKAITKTKSI